VETSRALNFPNSQVVAGELQVPGAEARFEFQGVLITGRKNEPHSGTDPATSESTLQEYPSSYPSEEIDIKGVSFLALAVGWRSRKS